MEGSSHAIFDIDKSLYFAYNQNFWRHKNCIFLDNNLDKIIDISDIYFQNFIVLKVQMDINLNDKSFFVVV